MLLQVKAQARQSEPKIPAKLVDIETPELATTMQSLRGFVDACDDAFGEILNCAPVKVNCSWTNTEVADVKRHLLWDASKRFG